MKTRIAHQEFNPQRTRKSAETFWTLCPLAKRVVIINYLIIIATAALLLTGCTYPEPAKVEQKDARPAIGISGAPEGTLLYVDGLKMGPVSSYDGTAGVLLVEGGKHVVEVKAVAGNTLFTQEIFLSGSTTKIIKYNP